MAELMKLLESNNPHEVADAKQKFHEQFNSVKESWLVYGLYEYYLSTNSTRSMEILVNVKEPHHYFLFDKITESIKGTKENMKVQGLTLLGHIVRRQPDWLYKITQHTIMKDLLKLLKNETDILPLLSALLALIVLLPMIPSLMGNYLIDVFEIFSRLASWNCNNPGRIPEEQMVHMQIALYALFLRLYGMYPCNFLAYLRDQYRMKEMAPIFTHTIKPMLNTVKMNPQLVITSKINETSTERWKKMGAHDVIVECERFSLDVSDNSALEPCFLSSFRSRSSTTTSAHYESPNQLHSLKNSQITYTNDREFFSPSMVLHCQTPPVDDICRPIPIPHSHLQSSVETTLISSVTHISQESSSPPEAAIEATPETTPIRDNRLMLNRIQPVKSDVARAITSFVTPTHSQPSSPMHKEVSPFELPIYGLQRLLQDRIQISGSELCSEGTIRPKTPKLAKLVPLKIENMPNFESTERLDSPLSQEDEEVLQIVHQGEMMQHSDLRQCDSVLHDRFKGIEDDLENSEQEQGSQCTAGGLHMPNTMSINNYIRRLRHHSQCTNEVEKYDTSAGNAVSFPNNLTVRRANSCPEMKQAPVVPAKDNMNSALHETDEDANLEYQENKIITNGVDATNIKNTNKHKLTTSETQTENFWPMPYEHLFLGIFPSLESSESKPSPAPSPAPIIPHHEKPQPTFVNDILDRYIDIAVHSLERDHGKQLQLLHQQLLFERYRREIHAIKNRRLFSDARNTRALEEHNSALRDQVQIKQKDIDDLKDQMEVLRREKCCREREAADNVTFWENRCKSLQQECQKLKDGKEDLLKEIDRMKTQYDVLNNKWQNTEAALLNTNAEVKIAKEQATAGERGRVELEQANRELLLLGELQLKYQERLNDLPLLKKTDTELNKLVDVCKHELKVLNQQLDVKTVNLEAYRMRVSELEHCIQQHDDSNSIQKRLLNEVKEECHERIKAFESKYQSQLTVNKYLEEKILELWQRCEVTAKRVISPDTSSCHEVNATLTDRTSTATGLSPHSSPLSASLASSEGSMAFTIPDIRDLKNLQVLVDQKEPIKPTEENVHTTIESCSSKLPSTSTKHD